MSLSNAELIHELVEKSGLCSDLTYYSGLPASRIFLNSSHLLKLGRYIKITFGEGAFNAFCMMVLEIPTLAPVVFLKFLYGLADNEWSWPIADQSRLMSLICLVPDNELQHEISLALLEERPATDFTDIIKAEFRAAYIG